MYTQTAIRVQLWYATLKTFKLIITKGELPAMRRGTLFVVFAIVVVLVYICFLVSFISKSYSKITNNESDVRSKQLMELAVVAERRDRELIKLKVKLKELENRALECNQRMSNESAHRPGVIVLGMHRSGTSVLGGLLTKMGLKTGGPLIGAAEDNSKGFFERIDVVLQNDWLFRKQDLHYSVNTYKYDALQGLKDIFNDDGTVLINVLSGSDGKKALRFFNDPANYPWMMKDPRLCITIRTWLPQLNFIPAVLFTYRHPMDVALSMHKRETEQFAIGRALRMWYVYNKRAVTQSHDLCRVTSSHSRLMTCGVDVPRKVPAEDVVTFIDVGLQHGRTANVDKSCTKDISTLVPPSSWQTQDEQHIILYREVMRAYCALEDGTAFNSSFRWDDAVLD